MQPIFGTASVNPAAHAFNLLAISAEQIATHWLSPGNELTLGRSPDCDVLLSDPSVSPLHARLYVSADVLELEDLGSERGTYVRGERLARNARVPFGVWDLVVLGDVKLVIQRREQHGVRRILPHGYFETRLEEECFRAERLSTEFGLVHLKLADKSSPQAFEEALAGTLRMLDILGLYGPGHYEVLLPDTNEAGVEKMVERTEDSLGKLGIRVQVSAARGPVDGKSVGVLMDKVLAPLLPPHSASAALQSASVEPAPSDRPAPGTIRHLEQLVSRIAASNISVLIQGETGVGKEKMAERVHNLSPRKDKPFLRLNCGALSENLLESELFGHERGAFTGAVQTKMGLLETAEGGTVFLDEIGDMPLPIQVKLLRVLEDRKVLRVGALKPRPIDVRFVSATHRDLEAEVERGRFREDLFFRLNGVSVLIPPLRERPDELEPIARALITQAFQSLDSRNTPELSAESLDLMRRYAWPGNIRELRNVLERALLLCSGGTITPVHLPVEKMNNRFATRRTVTQTLPLPAASAPLPAPSMAFSPAGPESGDERKRIEQALERAFGNQTEAAKMLGISRRTLINRLEDFGISGPRKRRG